MRLIIAVAEDLAEFAYGAIRDFFISQLPVTDPHIRPARISLPHALVVARPVTPTIVSAPIPLKTRETPVLSAPATKIEIPELTLSSAEHERIQDEDRAPRQVRKGTVMYTASILSPLRSSPLSQGDTVTETLAYGSMVMVLDTRDGWAYVASGAQNGWVHVDDLEDRAAHVYPSFHIGEANRDDDPSTIRLRALIGDEFGAGEIGQALQAEEYVLYRLYKKGIRPTWPPVRPRNPGSWQKILTGWERVSIGETPTPGSIMEFRIPRADHLTGYEESLGHLAYVEAVFAGSIQISEANWPDEGVYNERVLVDEEWRALNPVFISFK